MILVGELRTIIHERIILRICIVEMLAKGGLARRAFARKGRRTLHRLAGTRGRDSDAILLVQTTRLGI